MPCDSKDFATSGDFSTAAISVFSRATTLAGVPLGASTPYHMSTLSAVTPASARVGTSGNCGRRWPLPVASALSLPAWMCCSATCTGRNIASMRPPSRSVTAPAVPL
ncbi:hypothetical protein D9M72_317680 [compost metagenome]